MHIIITQDMAGFWATSPDHPKLFAFGDTSISARKSLEKQIDQLNIDPAWQELITEEEAI